MFIDEGDFRGPNAKAIDYQLNNNGCWISTSHKTNVNGYILIGRRRFNKKNQPILLHRYIYHLYRGEIPEGKIVMHSCDNPSCINPEHLSLGTQADNMRDKMEKGRHGFKKSRIDEKTLRDIFYDERPHKIIAEEYGLSRSYVTHVKNGRLRTPITKDF